VWIPLGALGGSGRRPWATIAIVALNVIVFVVAWPPERAASLRTEVAQQQLGAVELSIEHRYLPPRPAGDFAALIPSRFRKRASIEERFWTAFAAGEVVPLDDPEHVGWVDAVQHWEEARAAQPYWTWAVHDGSHNILAPLTSMFLHFGFFHLLFNMIFLWAVGASLEEVWGPGFYVLVYVLGGMLACAAEVLLGGAGDVPMAGASGAVAAAMGAFLARHGRRKIKVLFLFTLSTWAVPAWTLLGYWFASEVIAAVTTPATGVAHWAHVGGFAGGFVLGLTLTRGRLEDIVGPERERRERASAKAKHLAEADRCAARGDGRGLQAALEAALAADATDADLHVRVAQLRRTLEDHAGAWSHAEEALRLQWSSGRRDAFADTFRWATALPQARPSPALWLRAAEALAPTSVAEATQAAWKAVEAQPPEPLRSRALERYADLLEQAGDTERAGRVRAHLATTRR